MEKFEHRVRLYMWLNHGCLPPSLYGDDGEYQCNECKIDFKRDTIQSIINRVNRKGGDAS